MWYRSLKREVGIILLKALSVVLVVMFIVSFLDSWYNDERLSDGSCNIAIFPIEGIILPFMTYDEFPLVTTPSTVRNFVSRAENDPNIKAIVFEINSPGGTPVASAQVAEIIHSTALPTISLVGDLAASGGYLVAVAADKVIASPMSTVGSIGVTMSYTEISKQNEEDGITFVELASGKFKDAGNPNKPLSDEERAMFERDLRIVHEEFVAAVANYRSVAVETLQNLADGSSMPGRSALDLGLVDELGGRQSVKEALSGILNTDTNALVFCEYEAPSLF